MHHPNAVIDFWLHAGPKQWFGRHEAFDAQIRSRFEPLHLSASRGDHDDWAHSADGALALMLLLDQFPRNIYRGSAHAFATDPLARQHADRAIAGGFDVAVPPQLRLFFYLPFMHSERLEDQDRGVSLVQPMGDKDQLRWAVLHRDIIARFGRFPHRNAALGRVTTAEEQAFLDEGGFAG